MGAMPINAEALLTMVTHTVKDIATSHGHCAALCNSRRTCQYLAQRTMCEILANIKYVFHLFRAHGPFFTTTGRKTG